MLQSDNFSSKFYHVGCLYIDMILNIFFPFINDDDDDDDDIYSIGLGNWMIIPVNLLEEGWHLVFHEGELSLTNISKCYGLNCVP